jgi:hypothetical protein
MVRKTYSHFPHWIFPALVAFAACAQTNFQTTVTNFYADPRVRIVNGQTYNPERSQIWTNFSGEVVSRQRGVVVMETFKQRSQRAPAIPRGSQPGGYIGGPNIQHEIKWKEYGRLIAVTNVPGFTNVADGTELKIRAMRVGIWNDGDANLELWDCGAPYVFAVVRTNPPAVRVK